MQIHFPPNLSKLQEKTLKSAIEDWCLSSGLVVVKDLDSYTGVHAPVTLFPSPFSKTGFEEALRIQTSYNSVYANVTLDSDWLLGVLAPLEDHDEFTRQLCAIHRETATNCSQRLTGGLFRSDYIVTKSDLGRQIKQVEFNTVSVSFGGLSTKVTELHNYLANRSRALLHGQIPVSPSLAKLSEGIMHMHKAYVWGDAHEKKLRSRLPTPEAGDPKNPAIYVDDDDENGPYVETNDDEDFIQEEMLACVLFIVQPEETNVMDQRLLEHELWNKHGIPCFRTTLRNVENILSIGEGNRLIHLPTGQEVSVVYYRAGYSPGDYPSDKEWAARKLLESSHAIQCPSVLTQLAGAKKIQQELCAGEVLKKYTPELDAASRERLQRTFVNIYPMDESPAGLQGRKLAFEAPDKYVLKPQREGGGNNIYREDIVPFLESIPKESWGAYILMELIVPQRLTNRIYREKSIITGRVVNELGVFGACLWDRESGASLFNEQAGWLLRTKLQSSDEGGIAAGFGALDSVLLVSQRAKPEAPKRTEARSTEA